MAVRENTKVIYTNVSGEPFDLQDLVLGGSLASLISCAIANIVTECAGIVLDCSRDAICVIRSNLRYDRLMALVVSPHDTCVAGEVLERS